MRLSGLLREAIYHPVYTLGIYHPVYTPGYTLFVGSPPSSRYCCPAVQPGTHAGRHAGFTLLTRGLKKRRFLRQERCPSSP